MNGMIVIKKDREKPIRNQHPWIFSGAIEAVRGNPTPGDIVTVESHSGTFLARGYWNPKSQIQVRALTWHDEPIDESWWRRMLKRAFMARVMEQKKSRGFITAFRLVNAENDYLPGLVVDVYDRWCVLQALTLGIDVQKQLISRLLVEIFDEFYSYSDFPLDELPVIKGVYERSDVDVRGKEGLKPATGMLWGEPPPGRIRIQETDLLRYHVDVYKGHKTGFYIDQQTNRFEFLNFIVDNFLEEERGQRILNLFSYTGGFGVAGLKGTFGLPGYVVNVDASHEALVLAEENFRLNFSDNRDSTLRERNLEDYAEFIQADVFEYLRDIAAKRLDGGQQFDIVICDPPKFANSAQQVERAARGYKDLNLNAFKVIKPGGYLMTFSCSGAVSRDLFQKIVFGALADSGRQAQIIRHLSAGEDHPVALTFPEGEYLKGLLLRVY